MRGVNRTKMYHVFCTCTLLESVVNMFEVQKMQEVQWSTYVLKPFAVVRCHHGLHQ